MLDTPPIINPLEDDLLTDSQVGKLLGVSPVTIWRYRTKGKRGVVLPSIPWGHGHVTTAEAVKWFFAQLQHRQVAEPGAPSRRAIDAAVEAECEAAGI